MMHRGKRVDPGAITKTALLTVEGENDDISGIGQTQAAHDICVNIPETMRRDYIQPGVGHYGVFGSSVPHGNLSRMREFIRAFQSRNARRAKLKVVSEAWSYSRGPVHVGCGSMVTTLIVAPSALRTATLEGSKFSKQRTLIP